MEHLEANLICFRVLLCPRCVINTGSVGKTPFLLFLEISFNVTSFRSSLLMDLEAKAKVNMHC